MDDTVLGRSGDEGAGGMVLTVRTFSQGRM
jgi:hypothetical protein